MILVITSVFVTQFSFANSQIIHSDQWVTVVNESPIESSNNEFEFGDDCVVKAGGVVEEISRSTQDVLIRYSASSRTGGTLCPTGTEFLIEVQDFELMGFTYEEIKAKESNFKSYVKSIRKNEN